MVEPKTVTDQIGTNAASIDITEYHDCYESSVFFTDESALELADILSLWDPQDMIFSPQTDSIEILLRKLRTLIAEENSRKIQNI